MSSDNRTTHVADLLSPEGATVLCSVLAANGIARFRGARTTRSLLEVTSIFGYVVGHRDSDSDGVTTLAVRAGDAPALRGYAGFSRSGLVPHTDCSARADPPHLLIIACERPADDGGECLVVDARDMYAVLADEHAEVLHDLHRPRSAHFGGASGYLGAVFSEIPGRRTVVRLRFDDLARYSPAVERHVPMLRELVERLSITFSLSPGEGYVLDNHRWLHGRRAFSGERVVHRVHANFHSDSAGRRGFPSNAAERTGARP